MGLRVGKETHALSWCPLQPLSFEKNRPLPKGCPEKEIGSIWIWGVINDHCWSRVDLQVSSFVDSTWERDMINNNSSCIVLNKEVTDSFMSNNLTSPSCLQRGSWEAYCSYSIAVGNPNYRMWFLLENGNTQVGWDKMRAGTESRCLKDLTTGSLIILHDCTIVGSVFNVTWNMSYSCST